MNRARKMSFMLIEPLVVIVSIAILVPAMARAREEAQRINCAGNLKSIDLALLIYSGDYSGFMPHDTAHDTSFNLLNRND
ncbi:MAG TPA: hypothetical protein DCR55_06225 [Lentisphaeria bacterium]|nr:hypothetical protein [Lentisphaeria bacterium]